MTLKKYVHRATALLTVLLMSLSFITINNVHASACEYSSIADFTLIELNEEELQAMEETTVKYSNSGISMYKTYNPYFEYDYTRDYFYTQLNSEEKQLYRNMYDAAMELLFSDLDLEANPNDEYHTARYGAIEYSTNISREKLIEIYRAFRFSNPQFFFFGTCAFYGGWSTSGNTQHNYLYFRVGEEFLTASSRKAMISKIEGYTSEWMNKINQCSNWLEKEEMIYTILCNHITYGYGKDIDDINVYAEYHQTIAGAIGEGVCVCNGYAMAFNYLCHLAGIDSIGVVGTGHAWNRVKLYGNWYEIDVTWMDQTWGINMSYCNISTDRLLKLNTASHTPREDLYTYLYLPVCLYDEVIIAEVFGDINGDWEFDMDDVIDLARSVLFTTPGSQNPYLAAADLDNSGEIDMDDVILLARKLIMG